MGSHLIQDLGAQSDLLLVRGAVVVDDGRTAGRHRQQTGVRDREQWWRVEHHEVLLLQGINDGTHPARAQKF